MLLPLGSTMAFLFGVRGSLSREFTPNGYLGGAEVAMIFDASPWSLGELLVQDGAGFAYFEDPFA